MTAHEDLSARLYVRLYTSLLDDQDMVELSYAAVGVYAVTLLLAKHTAADGQVPVKLLRRDAALRPGTPLEEALDELAAAGLVMVADDVVTVRSWTKYNALSAEIVAKRKARQESARRANHERWHDGAFEDCRHTKCHVSPSGSESDPPRIGAGIRFDPYSKSDSHSDSHSDSDPGGSPPDPVPPVDNSGGVEAEAEAVEVAEELLTRIGVFEATARPDEIRYVGRALGLGWDRLALEDCATEAISADVTETRAYLRGMLRKRANSPPGPVASSPSAELVGTPPPRPDLGMSPPAGPQFGPDEGWDRWEHGRDGLATARAALRPDRPPPDP